MTRFDIITDHFELDLSDRRTSAYHANLRHGLSADAILDLCQQGDNGQHVVESYDDLDAARSALANKWAPLASTRFARSFAGIPLVTGDYYAIQENEYDEDGEWTGGGDLWDYAVEPYEVDREEDS